MTTTQTKTYKKNNWFKLLLTFLVIGGISLNACKKDDTTPETTPTAIFTSSNSELTVTFLNASTFATAYAWDFGDSKTSTDMSPVHTYAAAGTYTVKLTATDDNGKKDVATATVIVAKTPVAPVSSFSLTKAFLVVTFTNATTGASSYSWNFGDATTASTEVSPVHTYAAAGTYTVVLTATGEAGLTHASTATVTVVAEVFPVASFTHAETFLSVSFTNTSTDATTYSWDFGDASTASTETSPTHVYAAPGTYTVVLTAKDASNHTKTATATITVAGEVLPVANFSQTATDLSVSFTNSSTNATTYSWDFGDATTASTETSPTHVSAAAGTYSVKLTATDSKSKSDVKTVSITVTAAAEVTTVTFINGTFDKYDASALTVNSTEWKAVRDQNNDDWVCPSELEAAVKLTTGKSTIMAGMSTSKNTGTFALKFDNVGRRAYQAITVENGKSYTVKFWARTDATDATIYLEAYILSAAIADETTLATNLAKLSIEGTSSTYVEKTITFTATGTTAILYLRGMSDTVSSYFDDVTITKN
ncbi:MAG: hypothetical protein RIS47_678 [Bacteroidota bacterium]